MGPTYPWKAGSHGHRTRCGAGRGRAVRSRRRRPGHRRPALRAGLLDDGLRRRDSTCSAGGCTSSRSPYCRSTSPRSASPSRWWSPRCRRDRGRRTARRAALGRHRARWWSDWSLLVLSGRAVGTHHFDDRPHPVLYAGLVVILVLGICRAVRSDGARGGVRPRRPRRASRTPVRRSPRAPLVDRTAGRETIVPATHGHRAVRAARLLAVLHGAATATAVTAATAPLILLRDARARPSVGRRRLRRRGAGRVVAGRGGRASR